MDFMSLGVSINSKATSREFCAIGKYNRHDEGSSGEKSISRAKINTSMGQKTSFAMVQAFG